MPVYPLGQQLPVLVEKQSMQPQGASPEEFKTQQQDPHLVLTPDKEEAVARLGEREDGNIPVRFRDRSIRLIPLQPQLHLLPAGTQQVQPVEMHIGRDKVFLHRRRNIGRVAYKVGDVHPLIINDKIAFLHHSHHAAWRLYPARSREPIIISYPPQELLLNGEPVIVRLTVGYLLGINAAAAKEK